MRFRHLILTRFCVRIPEYAEGGGAGWLEHRFEIFERYCLPCVRSQSNQNFDWLLFCRTDMPEVFRERLAGYARPPNIHVVTMTGDFTQAAVQRAVDKFRAGFTHLITTRLDNDDGICRDFVEAIQTRFSGQELEFVNFTHGYVWREGRAYAGRHRSNAFLSLIERAERPSTVYCGNHMDAVERGPVRQIESPAGWLQVVHDRNLSNEVWGQEVAASEVLGNFAISAPQ